MSEFDETLWMEQDYAQEYRDNANHYVQERHLLYQMMTSFYRHFIGAGQGKYALDLGCGDGAIAGSLHRTDPSLQLTLLDGSEDMLHAARQRFAQVPDTQFILSTFEELITGKTTIPNFDFIASAFAIHHLSLPGKIGLFEQIFTHLNEGGAFLNIDTVLPNNPVYIDWYYNFWRAWIVQRQTRLKLHDDFSGVPERAKYNPENKLDTLQAQLEAMKRIGFKEVECHYKMDIFVVFGGRK
jgi:tRNA (cmo5U34)-methyltransferase